jgi:voltage-gated potassium channel
VWNLELGSIPARFHFTKPLGTRRAPPCDAMKTNSTLPVASQLMRQRRVLLKQIEAWLETPMLLLGFVWLVLLIIEFTRGLNRTLEVVGTVIWAIFVFDFALKFSLAPHKRAYLRGNWLTLLALLIPALRLFRIVRAVRVLQAARAARGLRLVRVLTSLNRGMKALSHTMGRRGFGYVLTLSFIVMLVGAAGMHTFEGEKLNTYGEALWWTAMLMTTLGSEYWPQSAEGRLLCFALALYAFGVFGYVTATLATFFIGRDAQNEDEISSTQTLEELRREIQHLREEVRALSQQTTKGQ